MRNTPVIIIEPLRGMFDFSIPRVARSASRKRDFNRATRGYDMKPLCGKIREYICEQEKQDQTEFELD